MTGGFPFALIAAICSVMGLTGFYSELLRPHLPDLLGVGILISPIILLVCVEWGDASDKTVARIHLLAVALFSLMAIGMEVLMWGGYQPPDSSLFRALAHIGWTFGWAVFYREAQRRRAAINPSPK